MGIGNYRDSDELLDEKIKVSWTSRLCLSPFFRYVLPSFALSLLFLLGLYLGVLYGWLAQEDDFGQSSCHLRPGYMVPCLPGRRVSLEECMDRHCCWRQDLELCYHAFPSRYAYSLASYTSSNGVEQEGQITALVEKSPSGGALIPRLGFSIHQVDDDRVRITLKTREKSNGKRIARSNDRAPANKGLNFNKLADFGRLFDFLPSDDEARVARIPQARNSTISVLVHDKPQFGVTLARSSGGEAPLLSTARGPLIVTADYWEWTLYLTNGSLYGLGSKLELNGTNNWLYNNENGTARPAFIGLDPQGNALSCYVDYDGPMEVQVLNESNLVILRGFSLPAELGIELSSGPTALAAVQQLAGAERRCSLRPQLQGLQLCPELRDLGTDSLSQSLGDTLNSMRELAAPWDSHCLYRELGLALENGASCTARADLSEARQLLRAEGKSFAGHLTPMLFNKAGKLRDALEKDSHLLHRDGLSYVGRYANTSCLDVVYPDWTSSSARELARSSLTSYRDELELDFVVIRDSWPKDEAEQQRLPLEASFDYLPEGLSQLMSRRTVPFELLSAGGGPHYASHNAYAERFADFVHTEAALPTLELRGHEANTAQASWKALRDLVQAGILAAMLGRMPTAMYVCGADSQYHSFSDELCVRWYGASVAWPRIIAHPDNSPAGKGLSRTAAKQAAKLLRLRASLATYQHTILAKYAKEGYPILAASPLYYPGEKQPWNTTQSQFMWGDAILVGLILQPKRSQVPMWLPGKLAWRHLQGGSAIEPTGNSSVPVTAVIGQIVTLVRPGRIVPVHMAGTTQWSSTAEAMQTKLTLLANVDEESRADGSIYYGEDSSTGEFLLVRLNATSLTLSNARKVRSLVCGSDTPTQASSIEAIQFGDERTLPINQDLCNSGNGDEILLDLSGIQPDFDRLAFQIS